MFMKIIIHVFIKHKILHNSNVVQGDNDHVFITSEEI